MPAVTRETILEAIRHMPPEEQRELAREILQISVAGSNSPMPARREPPAAPDPQTASATDMRGIAKTDTPIDDASLLDESRMERYS